MASSDHGPTHREGTAMNYDFAAHQALQKTAGERNLRTALRKLREIGATAFVVEYDGCGDEGQIEYSGIEGAAPDLEVRACAMRVCFWYVKTIAPAETDPPVFRYRLARSMKRLTELATDALCDHMESLWGGWENNDGAFGTIRLEVDSAKVTLEHNSRYTDHETSVSELALPAATRRVTAASASV
jgi:hypothetical protein